MSCRQTSDKRREGVLGSLFAFLMRGIDEVLSLFLLLPVLNTDAMAGAVAAILQL